MVSRSLCRLLCFGLVLFLMGASQGRAAAWLPYGPDGGDARSFAVDPSNHAHLFLGTANGWIYETSDSGAQWKRLALVGKRDDLVLDTILVDGGNSKHLLVGAWVLDHADGGIYQSSDAGKTWTTTADMAGESVRSLAASASDPKTVVAGTLKGVFGSADAGQHWRMISPPASTEIHEVQSLAVDPLDPLTIYAGTWHLPWKTTDGGVTWAPIKQGVIDDSDVFSIIVDPVDPNIVFASACSGIYKSQDKGEKFKKIQGIPNSARRTLVLMQDPTHQNVVFAGTTEGLWRTEDSGTTWSRTTGPEVIVNDVYIDPTDTQRILLATDRGGVLTSEDGGGTFAPSNRGFSARQITAVLSDAQHSGTVYAGLVNDKEWGGVFVSADGGLTWTQRSKGLSGRDVFSLGQASDGTLLAGTAHGIFRLEDELWVRATDDPAPTPRDPSPQTARPASAKHRAPPMKATGARADRGVGSEKTRVVSKKTRVLSKKTHVVNKKTRVVPVKGRTTGAVAPKSVRGVSAAASPATRSSESTAVVRAPAAMSLFDGSVHAIVVAGETLLAGTSRGLLAGDATGRVWHVVPSMGDEEWRFLAASQRTVLAASTGVMMLSTDAGETWSGVALPGKVTQISAVAVDGRGELWVGSREGVYLSSDKGMSWQTLKNLYVRDVDSLFFDPATDQILVTANGNATIAFAVEVRTRKVTFWDTGWTLRLMRPVGDHLVGATLFDGFVIQPQMVEAKGSGGG